MRREKHVIIEDINSTENVEHIVLMSDDNKKDDVVGCLCFNHKIVKYFIDLLN